MKKLMVLILAMGIVGAGSPVFADSRDWGQGMGPGYCLSGSKAYDLNLREGQSEKVKTITDIDAAVKGYQTRRLGRLPGQASGIDLRFRGLRSPEIAVEGLRQFSCPLDGLVVDLPIFLFFDSLDLPG